MFAQAIILSVSQNTSEPTSNPSRPGVTIDFKLLIILSLVITTAFLITILVFFVWFGIKLSRRLNDLSEAIVTSSVEAGSFGRSALSLRIPAPGDNIRAAMIMDRIRSNEISRRLKKACSDREVRVDHNSTAGP